MKIASIIEAIKKFNGSTRQPINYLLVHTGQHYDEQMSQAFFKDLALPQPDVDLEVGSSSHAQQTAEIMKRFEPVLLKEQPDVVLVVGDVNSTVACSLVASKIEYPTQHPTLNARTPRRKPLVAHVEAGLRSFDRSMPEEINRILTDQLSDFLFVSEPSGLENLRNEGFRNFVCEDILTTTNDLRLTTNDALPFVVFVGNTMIDTLLKHREVAQKSDILERLRLRIPTPNTPHPSSYAKGSVLSPQASNGCGPFAYNLQPPASNVGPYAVLTLHRASNVDNQETFRQILDALSVISKEIPIFFPAHPRTMNRIKEFHLGKYFIYINLASMTQHLTLNTQHSRIFCFEPLGYLDFLCLISNAKLALTDSGGIQEETTVLGIQCVTLRENTERPITIRQGTNVLAGTKKRDLIYHAFSHLEHPLEAGKPKFWDGLASERIIKILAHEV